ncbi:MAG: hypothetical protein HND44_08095 [Chloroflexi bacterium]|nr:hypothetical protein [Ardenticatenaceae bacterium]MBL1128443.1 hypothetical protein [Chloroflexota bacterium]NOG34521.1 hypothetical protein [Chloroflexota bacterium]
MRRKNFVLLLLLLAAGLFLVLSLPVAAKQIPFLNPGQLLNLAWEQGATGENLELIIITDQEQIRDELKKLGVNYDDAIGEMLEGIEGAGGHAGAMYCPGPRTANDLFLTSTGPFGTGFFGGSISNPVAISGCVGAGVCDAFPACLVNAVCPVPAGHTAIAYAVAAALTTDFGPGCSP